ncbi:MAG: hypothetical protein LKM30_07775 [Bacilli bacterium]|nr:hypothetical protein [Bacilli bacterium]
MIYSDNEIKAEDISVALKKVYPDVRISEVDELRSFSFETRDNHGFVYLQEYEKDGSPTDYDETKEALGDQISYFKDQDHISCTEIDGSDPEFIDHVTDDILSTIPGAVIEGKNGKLYEKK